MIGGSGGSGTLNFHGRRYPLSIGGISYGFTFGASETNFYGTVSNIRRPSDVAGVYGQAGVGAAVVRGAQGVVLTNQNGAVLTLSGRQTGLIVSADLSGLALSLEFSLRASERTAWPAEACHRYYSRCRQLVGLFF